MWYNEVMITENIIVAVIAGIFAFAGVALSNYTATRKNSIEQASRDTKIEDKIQELSDRVDAHNGMQDRIASIEKAIVRIDTKLEDK